MIFDARKIAKGWLSVALASATDDSRPALYRTVAIESFPEGVRLVATDSYILLRSWVPAINREDDPEPSLDEAPAITAVAIDTHGRAAHFLKHMLKLANEKGAPDVEVRLSLGVVEVDDEIEPGTFAGMEATYVVLEHPDHERVKLRTYEGQYPSWRKLAFSRQTTDAVAIHPERIGALAKLTRLHGDMPLQWWFGGRDRPAAVAIGDPLVEGLVMPVKWDLDRDAPAETAVEAADGASEA